VLAGGTAGGIGIAFANPTDLIKIRMQADREGTRYRGTVHAFKEIIRSEGVLGLWKGVGPAVQRAIIVNAAELATYDQAKDILIGGFNMKADNVSTHFSASFMAGFCSAVASSPVDVIKNRLMSQPSGAGRLYKGVIDCGIKTIQNEGIRGLYNGFIPNWFRLGPWCMVMFMTYEQYRIACKPLWQNKE
jgi:solute carrier family 25 (mitochondrial carrier), member 14/30